MPFFLSLKEKYYLPFQFSLYLTNQSSMLFFFLINMTAAMFWHIAICMLFCGFIVSSSHQTDHLNILTENPNQVSSSSNFLFGTSSSCYQVLPTLVNFLWMFWVQLFFLFSPQFEGAFLNDGKGLNNWDVFTHEAGQLF